ncbi:PREDICTED: F-box/kelch-repeat protein At3g23880-like [Nicotiana attenuata]|uniref:F-box/kelch-repeat protein At3g23880-like n=1 Tax=Nicotiana attenuata TaxID=49451 RepID=UPI00090554EC|nr:PREDICTED: F-box/kelch-repeat protein At3g23880-like [Nicotiana attenuata]
MYLVVIIPGVPWLFAVVTEQSRLGRKFKKLPDCGVAGYYFMFGFGYDVLHDDYKVVGIYRNLSYKGLHNVEIKLYSLDSDSWRSIDDFQTGMLFIKSGIFVNGKLHWANTTSRNPSYKGWDIISINVADGKWVKVEKPCYGKRDFDFSPCLGVLGSDLSVFCNIRKTHTNVWVMKDYKVKESRTKMFTIKCHFDSEDYLFHPPFYISNEGGILFEIGSIFMIYNPMDDSIRYPGVTNYYAFFGKDLH